MDVGLGGSPRAQVQMADFSDFYETVRKLLLTVKSQIELAEQLGVSQTSVSKWARNQMDPSKDSEVAVYKLAREKGLGVHAEPLANLALQRSDVVGYISGDASVIFTPENGHHSIESANGKDTFIRGLEVRGQGMSEFASDGSTVYYTEPQEAPVGEFGDRWYVISLEDGRTLVRHMMMGTEPDTYTLYSRDHKPIANARIRWAARIKYVSLP